MHISIVGVFILTLSLVLASVLSYVLAVVCILVISIRIRTTLNMNMIVRIRGNISIHSSMSTIINASVRFNIAI